MKQCIGTLTSCVIILKNKHDYNISDTDMVAIEQAILGLEVMPSMRAMMTAGDALARDNICGYNCSYIPVDILVHLTSACTFSCAAQA